MRCHVTQTGVKAVELVCSGLECKESEVKAKSPSQCHSSLLRCKPSPQCNLLLDVHHICKRHAVADPMQDVPQASQLRAGTSGTAAASGTAT